MFSRFFIYHPIFASVVSIVIVIAGGITIPILPIEQTPDITPPTVSVSTTYRGASAQVVAQTVAQVIEEEVNGVEDMIYMSSKSSDDGKYELTVTFAVGTDIDMATVLVQNRVSIAQPKLPEEVKQEGVKTEKRSTAMVLMVNMISDKDPQTGKYFNDELVISNYASAQVKDVLARIPGVGKVDVMGARDYGIRFWIDPNRLMAVGLTTMDVVEAISEQNVQVAAGQIGGEPAAPGQQFQYTVSTLGRLTDPEEFADMIVKVGEGGRAVRMRDIAEVELGAQSYNWSVELNQAPSIALAIYQLPGANSLNIADGIQAEMVRLKKSFPKGLDYQIAYDTTMFVRASIADVVETLFVAVVLVVFTVYVFLQDFRTTLIPAATIPVSLIGTFGVMMLMGISINTISLFGIVLVIGIVVDDAIVVVENTLRIIDDEGLSAKEATAKSMLQVTGPVIATTLVLLAVFVPTAMMGGITGRLYSQFALTIATATVISSINALTLSPALCGVLLRPSPKKRGLLFTAFNKGMDFSTGIYQKIVGVMVRHTLVSGMLFVGMVALMVYLFGLIPGGFLPNEDQGYVIVNAQLPDGATLERSQQVTDEITKIARETPGVADVIGIAGYAALDSLATTNASTLFVVLKPWEQRPDPSEHAFAIVRSLQEKFNKIQQAICLAFPPPPITGLGQAGGFEFQLQDRGAAGVVQLEAVANDIVQAGNQDPVLNRMNNNFRAQVPQLFVDVDRVKAKKMNVPLQSIFSTLQAALGSAYVNDFNKFGRTYKVLIQAAARFRSQVEDIGRLRVRNAAGEMVPLGTLISVRDTAGPKTVYRFNAYPSATITGEGAPGYSEGQAVTAMDALATRSMPAAMGYQWSGTIFQQLKAGSQTPIIFTMAILFVYLFLAAQYESWSIPLAVLFSVPLAILGALVATWARSYDNNIYTQIGLVLLIGLSAKVAILIVEFAKERHEEGGLSIVEAALEASRLRFRAILMTAFSFILGVIPLVIASGAGSASRRALGTAVFGGMSASTVLGIFLVPVFYVIVQTMSEWLSGGPQAKAESTAAPADKVS
ncbi:MAG: multidrug efflux RND transporter permease subunit [Pirellulales bacterium]